MSTKEDKHNTKIVDGEIEYTLEKKLIPKFDLSIKDIVGDDNQNFYSENHGDTGSGKTNASLVQAHYVKMHTGRPIHLFFRLNNLLEFAKNTEHKIIIWDEPAFTSLSTDQRNKLNTNLLRLINTSRVKRHYIIINFTKFWRFPVDIVVDTCKFMLHIQKSKRSKERRFLYIRRKNLEYLWNDYKNKKQRNYVKYMSFGGSVPFIMDKYFDKLDITIEGKPHCVLKDYDDLKQKSINAIGNQNIKKDKNLVKALHLRKGLGTLEGINKETLAAHFGIASTRLREWAKIDPDSMEDYLAIEKEVNDGVFEHFPIGKEDLKGSNYDKYDTTMGKGGEKSLIDSDNKATEPIITLKDLKKPLNELTGWTIK